jgi:hypothetical protein
MQSSGPSHLPYFEVKVVCDSREAYGSGSSKQRAKKDAAVKWISQTEPQSLAPVTRVNPDMENQMQIPFGTNSNDDSEEYYDNPVGTLQEYAQSFLRRNVIPIYTEGQSDGSEGFEIICNLEGKESRGHAATKKNAKSAAATAMLRQLNVTKRMKSNNASEKKETTPVSMMRNIASSSVRSKSCSNMNSPIQDHPTSSSYAVSDVQNMVRISSSSTSSLEPCFEDTIEEEVKFFRKLKGMEVGSFLEQALKSIVTATEIDFVQTLGEVIKTLHASYVINVSKYEPSYEIVIKIEYQGTTVMTGYGVSIISKEEAIKTASMKLLNSLALMRCF